MKTTNEIFKEVLDELGFSGYKPSQMSNSDYWMCTERAMEKYAKQTQQEQDKNKYSEEQVRNAIDYGANLGLEQDIGNSFEWTRKQNKWFEQFKKK
jgi:hypothetical protein